MPVFSSVDASDNPEAAVDFSTGSQVRSEG